MFVPFFQKCRVLTSYADLKCSALGWWDEYFIELFGVLSARSVARVHKYMAGRLVAKNSRKKELKRGTQVQKKQTHWKAAALRRFCRGRWDVLSADLLYLFSCKLCEVCKEFVRFLWGNKSDEEKILYRTVPGKLGVSASSVGLRLKVLS